MAPRLLLLSFVLGRKSKMSLSARAGGGGGPGLPGRPDGVARRLSGREAPRGPGWGARGPRRSPPGGGGRPRRERGGGGPAGGSRGGRAGRAPFRPGELFWSWGWKKIPSRFFGGGAFPPLSGEVGTHLRGRTPKNNGRLTTFKQK